VRIRANQGHSVDIDLQLPPRAPPERLYHGTIEAALEGIRAHGLVRGQRRHVHLSADVPTATRVGQRRGAPVILTVRATDMHAAGYPFYCADNGVWLTEHVPVRFILFQGPQGTGSVSRGAKVQIARQTLAACDAGAYTNAVGEPVSIRDALEAAKDGTVLHDLERGGLERGGLERGVAVSRVGAASRVEVTPETTIEAIVRLAGEPGGHLACLNYASAKNPGGGFLGGSQAQEESLARSSGLYPCLLRQPEHYARNRANRPVMYHDLAIFSPHVPFFRDDDGGWLDRPVLASVITCAAPNASALRQQQRFDAGAVEHALRRRAAFVLAIAAHHGVRRLILGAWGAGAFGNDPAVVAAAFREPLGGDFAGAFDEVVFAVPPGPNQPAFAAAFGAAAAGAAAAGA
jgi:uncharacterized protein (TIGR02452 family)